MHRATTRANRVAVLSFNLLGRQAATCNVNWAWVETTLRELEEESRRDPESQLFRTRFEELTEKMAPAQAIDAYRALVAGTPRDASFTWTGVKDSARIDSYFDPFGNLTIRQRASLELARVLFAAGAKDEASGILVRVEGELDVRKSRQLESYAADYVRP